MPDFGSLFGTGPATAPVDFGSLWKPASFALDNHHHKRKDPTFVPHVRQKKRSRPPPINFSAHINGCNSFDDILVCHTTLYPDGDVPIDFSKAALDQLLDLASRNLKLDDTGRVIVESQDTDDIIRFLQHDLNHDQAANLHSYFHWLTQHTPSATAITSFSHLLHDKIAQSNIPWTEVVPILANLTHRLSTALDQHLHNDLILSVYDHLSQAIHTKRDRFLPDQRCAIDLAILQGLTNLPPSHRAAAIIADATTSFANKTQFNSVLEGQSASAIDIISQHLHTWLSSASTTHDLADTSLTQLLSALSATLTQRQFAKLILTSTTDIVRTVLENHDSDAVILRWLSLLSNCPALDSNHESCATWLQIYDTLAKHFSPAFMHSHLFSLGSVLSAKLICRHWVRPYIMDKSLTRVKTESTSFTPDGCTLVSYTVSASEGEKIAANSLRLQGSHQATAPRLTTSVPILGPDEVMKSVQTALRARISAYSPACDPITSPYVDLVVLLHKHAVPADVCHHILDDIFQLLLPHLTPTQILTFTFKLLRRSVYLSPATSLRLVHFMIDAGHPGYALRIFHACPNVWPSLCPELIFALIDNGAVHTKDLFDILNRPEYVNSLPEKLRLKKTNTLSEQRVQLIHHVALALSKSPHLTPRQAFRRVCDCVHYLQDRRAPLSSLITRALVQAGVIRPLQQGEWVSTVKFSWILELVRTHEGHHVADLLDKVTFDWRASNARNPAVREHLRKRLAHMHRQTDAMAARWRRSLPHKSMRWKRQTAQWKPWLREQKTSSTEVVMVEEVGQVSASEGSAANG